MYVLAFSIPGEAYSVRREIDKICQANFDMYGSQASSLNPASNVNLANSRGSLAGIETDLTETYILAQNDFRRTISEVQNMDSEGLQRKHLTLKVEFKVEILILQSFWIWKKSGELFDI